MKLIYTIFLFVLLLVSACNTKKAFIPDENNKSNAELLIQLKKSPCYGECPVYIVQIFDNGHAKYNGVKFVEKIGKFNGQLDNRELLTLKEQLSLSLIDSLSSTYLIPFIADLPSTTLKIQNKIIEYHESKAPKEIKSLENHLLQITDNLNWTSATSSTQ